MLTGQAISGVLASCMSLLLAQLNVPADRTSFVYFGTALGVEFLATLVLVRVHTLFRGTSASTPESTEPRTSDSISSQSETSESLTQWDLIRVAFPYATPVLLAFVLTLAVFPGLVTALAAEAPTANQRMVVAGAFLAFNLGDMVGRWAPSLLKRPVTPKALWIFSFIRFVWIPIFMLFPLPGGVQWLPALITHPLGIWMCVFWMAWTGGAIVTLSMTMAPAAKVRCGSQFRDLYLHERSKMGQFLTLAMLVGLTTGAGLGFLVNQASNQ